MFPSAVLPNVKTKGKNGFFAIKKPWRLALRIKCLNCKKQWYATKEALLQNENNIDMLSHQMVRSKYNWMD